MVSQFIFDGYSSRVHDYDKHKENPSQKHVAHLNMELKGLHSTLYCIGNLLMFVFEFLL
jgi:hypothetical protein